MIEMINKFKTVSYFDLMFRCLVFHCDDYYHFMIILPLSCSVTISFNCFFISFTIAELEKCKVFLINCYEFRIGQKCKSETKGEMPTEWQIIL